MLTACVQCKRAMLEIQSVESFVMQSACTDGMLLLTMHTHRGLCNCVVLHGNLPFCH